MNKIIGIIITYNPDIELLRKNINAVISQVDRLVVYDNNSSNIAEILILCQERGIQIFKNSENQGVAGPLNESVLLAKELGYSFILTLDQDSVATPNMVCTLKKVLEGDEKIGMVGPHLFDDRISRTSANEIVFSDDSTKIVNSIFTSGALARVNIILEIGNYIKEMFIDQVDFDICYRLRASGYNIKCVPRALLIHHLGNPVSRRILWKTVFPRNYSAFRLYYIARNTVFCKLKYPEFYLEHKKSLKIIKRQKLLIILFEHQKIEKLCAIKKGFKDAQAFFNSYGKKNG